MDVIELPDPDHAGGLTKGVRVLALFPATTSFYGGSLVQAERNGNGCYGVRFDDDEEDGKMIRKRNIPCCYVIPFDEP